MKITYSKNGIIEAGCDEAGRGCLAGPVSAAAVILPTDFYHKKLNDSKQISEKTRLELRKVIEENAIAYSVQFVDHKEIDKMNILHASFKAMHLAVDDLQVRPELLLIDGNRFTPYSNIDHVCVVKGDSKFASIAAASVLAKTYRDELMLDLDAQYPMYGWCQNKGYPTKIHREAVMEHGLCPYHRKTFNATRNL